MGTPFALDYNAVLAMAAAHEADAALLAEVLPAAEAAILSRFAEDDEGGE